jgi:transcription initiation factor IIE alpha subunit
MKIKETRKMERAIKACEAGSVVNNNGLKERISTMMSSLKEKAVAFAKRKRREKNADDIYYYYIHESQRHSDMARAEYYRHTQLIGFR